MLKFYDSTSERKTMVPWESVPELESFGIADTKALSVPWSSIGKSWWTHTTPSFSLAKRSWSSVSIDSRGHVVVDGKRIAIPEGIYPDLSLDVEHMAASISDYIVDTIKTHAEVDHTSMKVVDGLIFVLMINSNNDNLIWGLIEPGTALFRGAGKILYPLNSTECTVSSASLEESLQGKGVYQKVLRHIRQTTNAPVYSDNRLSLKAALAWMRMGDVVDGPYGKRFKLRSNPSRPRSLYARILRETVLSAMST